MKLLIIGCNGMLGSDMAAAAKAAGHEVQGIDFPEIDITKPESVRKRVASANPGAIINCAAYTAVDACETNAETAFAVNAQGAENLARAAEERKCIMVHYSTDYVFNGTKAAPYVESDPASPATVYGKSKLQGEKLVQAACSRLFVLRIAWLYGKNGNNFVKTIRTLAQKNAAANLPLRVVHDQKGTPTYTIDVCRQSLSLVPTGHYGLYHATSEGSCTWFDFAREIVSAAQIPVHLLPCATAEFPRPAPRPENSILENAALKKLGLNIMPDWRDAFRRFLQEEKE
jgi:dTDP-4-dehydrorhamnose reductase